MPAETSVTLYWIRNNRDGSDNAAIEATSLDSNYRYASVNQSQIMTLILAGLNAFHPWAAMT